MRMREGNNVPITRGRPFQPGNPGRPKGARHKVTVAVEALLEGEAEGLTRKAIELAKGWRPDRAAPVPGPDCAGSKGSSRCVRPT